MSNLNVTSTHAIIKGMTYTKAQMQVLAPYNPMFANMLSLMSTLDLKDKPTHSATTDDLSSSKPQLSPSPAPGSQAPSVPPSPLSIATPGEEKRATAKPVTSGRDIRTMTFSSSSATKVCPGCTYPHPKTGNTANRRGCPFFKEGKCTRPKDSHCPYMHIAGGGAECPQCKRPITFVDKPTLKACPDCHAVHDGISVPRFRCATFFTQEGCPGRCGDVHGYFCRTCSRNIILKPENFRSTTFRTELSSSSSKPTQPKKEQEIDAEAEEEIKKIVDDIVDDPESFAAKAKKLGNTTFPKEPKLPSHHAKKRSTGCPLCVFQGDNGYTRMKDYVCKFHGTDNGCQFDEEPENCKGLHTDASKCDCGRKLVINWGEQE